MAKMLTYTELSYRGLQYVGESTYQYIADGTVYTVQRTNDTLWGYRWVEYSSDYRYAPTFFYRLSQVRARVKYLQSIWQ